MSQTHASNLARRHFSVQLQLLDACNLKCGHCYNAGPPSGSAPPTADIIRRIDSVADFCSEQLEVTPAFHLSGGEPTLRQDLPRIIEYITSARGCEVLLFTNGTRWTPDFASRLQSSGLKYVQVSVEGPESLNDEVRGAGTFRAAMATIEMLVNRGLRVTLSLTITDRNCRALEDFIRNLDPLGLHFHLREVLPIGAGAQCPELTRTQRRALYAWAIAYRGHSTVGLEDPIHCSADAVYAKACRGCVAARNHFCVDVDGTVYACRPLRLAVGHVDNLKNAWQSPMMARLRRRQFEGRCGRCELREHCGGCRVHALKSGNVFGEDPRCFATDNGLVQSG